MRNEFITGRMYAIDIEYTAYENSLSKESQDEGFAAAVANAALTGTAALVPVAHTARMLSGIAAGATTVDQAYNKQYLLNKAVQILQGQMRAKRSEIATEIIARLKSPVVDYPLGMAMSDLEEYYRAGTLSGALIDVSTAVGTQASISKESKNEVKPAAAAIADAKGIAVATAPLGKSTDFVTVTPSVRTTARNPMPNSREAIIAFERAKLIQQALCVPSDGDLGKDFGSVTRNAISQFKAGVAGKTPADARSEDGVVKTPADLNNLTYATALRAKSPTGSCGVDGETDPFKIGQIVKKNKPSIQ